jgi:D-lactate dehydrogenase (cytochrome)
MIANNASGVQTIKYGATKDYVMRLMVVLPDGRVIHTGGKAHKSSSGYDLTRLFVGSEGTLGVVTEATLKLAGIPVVHLAATVTFDALEAASETVAVLMGSGLAPAALELLTPELIALMNREKDLGLAEKPSLFCEFHGISEAALKETARWPKSCAGTVVPLTLKPVLPNGSERSCGGPAMRPGRPFTGPIRGEKP